MNAIRGILLIISLVVFSKSQVQAQDNFLLKCEKNGKVYGPYEFKEGQKIINQDFCLASVKDDKFHVHGFIRGIKRIWGPFCFTNGAVMSVAEVPLELIAGKDFEKENELRIKKEQAYDAECLAQGMEKFEGEWKTKTEIADIKERRLEFQKREQVSPSRIRDAETDEDNEVANTAKEFVKFKIQEGVLLDAEFLKVETLQTQGFIEELTPNNDYIKRCHAWFRFKYMTEAGRERWNIGPINVAFESRSKTWQVVHFGNHAITGIPYQLTKEGDAAIDDFAKRTIGDAFSRLGGSSSKSKR